MTARVLVVDDINFNRKLLDTKLKQEYYQVFTAENVKDAIEKTRELKPDVILMDVMMPEMNGIEATKIIKYNDGTFKCSMSYEELVERYNWNVYINLPEEFMNVSFLVEIL
jgi:CheY-like chemotaxis protein